MTTRKSVSRRIDVMSFLGGCSCVILFISIISSSSSRNSSSSSSRSTSSSSSIHSFIRGSTRARGGSVTGAQCTDLVWSEVSWLKRPCMVCARTCCRSC